MIRKFSSETFEISSTFKFGPNQPRFTPPPPFTPSKTPLTFVHYLAQLCIGHGDDYSGAGGGLLGRVHGA